MKKISSFDSDAKKIIVCHIKYVRLRTIPARHEKVVCEWEIQGPPGGYNHRPYVQYLWNMCHI
jgi:hypothetical protein